MAAITRAARIADGWYPHAISPDDFVVAAELLRTEARRAGRNPDDVPISITAGSADREREMDLAWVQHYVTHGATRLVIRPGIARPDDVDAVRIRVEKYRELVLDKLVLPDPR